MEKWCNIVIGVAVIYIVANWITCQNLSFQSIIVANILLLQSAVLWYYARRNRVCITTQSSYRPNASSGIFCVLLVPLALLGEVCAKKQSGGPSSVLQEIWLSLAVLAVILLRLALADNQHFQLYLLVVLPLFGAVLVMSFSCKWLSVFPLATSYFVWKCLKIVPEYLPKSFTLGELAVVLQLLTVWVNRMGLSAFQASFVHKLDKEDIQLAWFVCTLVTAVVIATVIVYWTTAYSSLGQFLAVYVVMAILSLLLLRSVFGENPVLWLLKFVSSSCTKIFLLLAWIILLAVAVVWAIIHSFQLNSNVISSQDMKYTVLSTDRKVFHAFIVLVYFPGLLLDVRLLLLASVAALGLFIVMEAARALHVPVLGEHLDAILRIFVDDRDQGLIFLTHIYLLIGLSLPLWISRNLFSPNTAPLELYSGILSLGVGDTVACVAGKALGRNHWPGSKKTVEGTLCSVLSQMMLVLAGSHLGIIFIISWWNVFAGICLSALVEAFTDQIDNLILPVVLYPFLCLA
ncbi:unnamed protein product [Candidula unifasciata]|uniref:dolichol kinase n=1 Tax=Candidula unifasciata TaxID=100452 RepID=A0A8S3ZGK8_9EUPU|nr:unnamed protein product [Candidula unifasciata]